MYYFDSKIFIYSLRIRNYCFPAVVVSGDYLGEFWFRNFCNIIHGFFRQFRQQTACSVLKLSSIHCDSLHSNTATTYNFCHYNYWKRLSFYKNWNICRRFNHPCSISLLLSRKLCDLISATCVLAHQPLLLTISPSVIGTQWNNLFFPFKKIIEKICKRVLNSHI